MTLHNFWTNGDAPHELAKVTLVRLQGERISGAGTVLFDPTFEMDVEIADSAPMNEVLKTLPSPPEGAN